MKASHRNTLESIPWMVTGRLSESDRRSFERHVRDCAECRDELALQQKIQLAMSNEPQVDYAPGASLQKLWTRIGTAERLAPPPVTAQAPRITLPKIRFIHWLAAAVVVEAVGIAFLAFNLRPPAVVEQPPAPYRTVTTTEIVPQTAALRVVFAPTFSTGELTALLREHRLTVVSGPTAAGVYTLATDKQSVELANSLPSTLAALRANEGVRLAEPIGPATNFPPTPPAEMRP
jgi:hypothetical protein